MAVDSTVTLESVTESASLVLDVNGSTLTLNYDAGAVTSPARLQALEMTRADYQALLQEIQRWMNLITGELAPPGAATGSYQHTTEKSKPNGTMEMRAQMGGTDFKGEWNQSNDMFELSPRAAFALAWRSFQLLVQVHGILLNEVNNF